MIERKVVNELCTLIVDCVNKTAPVVDHPTPYRMIRTTNIRNGRIDMTTARSVTKGTFVKWTRRADVQNGDVLLTREAPIGEVGLVDNLGTVFLGQRIMQYRPNPKVINPRFFYYSFRSRDLQHQFGSHEGSGSVVSHIRVGDCHKFEMNVPSRQRQNSIANFLGSLDDKIEINRQMNETLEAMARALFRDWFVDFGPTRRQMAGATDPVKIMGSAFPHPEKAAKLADLFPAELGEDGLPVGWETRELRSVLTLNYGKSLPKKKRVAGAFTVYGSGGTTDSHNTALAKGPSVIVGRKGTVGSLYWTRENFYAIDTVFYVTSNLPMVYCHRLLETLGLETMNTDAAVPGLNRENAYRQEFTFGGGSIAEAYSLIAQSFTDKMDSNGRENKILASLRDLLLPSLMSGEIQLKGKG